MRKVPKKGIYMRVREKKSRPQPKVDGSITGSPTQAASRDGGGAPPLSRSGTVSATPASPPSTRPAPRVPQLSAEMREMLHRHAASGEAEFHQAGKKLSLFFLSTIAKAPLARVTAALLCFAQAGKETANLAAQHEHAGSRVALRRCAELMVQLGTFERQLPEVTAPRSMSPIRLRIFTLLRQLEKALDCLSPALAAQAFDVDDFLARRPLHSFELVAVARLLPDSAPARALVGASTAVHTARLGGDAAAQAEARGHLQAAVEALAVDPEVARLVAAMQHELGVEARARRRLFGEMRRGELPASTLWREVEASIGRLHERRLALAGLVAVDADSQKEIRRNLQDAGLMTRRLRELADERRGEVDGAASHINAHLRGYAPSLEKQRIAAAGGLGYRDLQAGFAGRDLGYYLQKADRDIAFIEHARFTASPTAFPAAGAARSEACVAT